jgi:hypothetical protein
LSCADPDLNTLALGSDLTTLGLNLNASEALYTTFASPWVEGPTSRDPKFFLPQCYNLQKQCTSIEQRQGEERRIEHWGIKGVTSLVYVMCDVVWGCSVEADALQQVPE